MKEVLLNIGSIIAVEEDDEFHSYIIVGKRTINFRSMRAWDYYGVPYPEGNKKDRDGNDDNGFYFNHTDIDKVIHKCNFNIDKNTLNNNLQK